MTRSYRSTKPIIEFTRRLVPNGERIIPFERDGERPVLTQLLDHTELHRCIVSKVADLRSLGYKSIAIICKSAEESIRAYESLSSIEEIKHLKTARLNMNKELLSYRRIYPKASNSTLLSFMTHQSKYTVMRAFEEYSILPALERCMICSFTV